MHNVKTMYNVGYRSSEQEGLWQRTRAHHFGNAQLYKLSWTYMKMAQKQRQAKPGKYT